MALTSQQRAVFGLAVEIMECNGAKAMDHTAHAHVQRSGTAGQRTVVEWAVDYLSQLNDIRNSHLVVKAHIGSGEWKRWEISACGAACRCFYRKVHDRKLYAAGVRFLSMFNGE